MKTDVDKKDGPIKGTVLLFYIIAKKIGLNFTTIIVNYFLPFKAEAVSIGKKRHLKRYKFMIY